MTEKLEGSKKIMDENLKKDDDNPCVACDDEHEGCQGCGGKRERADTWWYVIALLVILLLALFFKRGGST